MPNVVYISKIQIPINNEPVVFEFYDSDVQQKLAGGISFNVCWDGGGIPTVEDVPYGVVINYNDTDYTGTLSANSADPLTFYLVKSSTQINNRDVYEEYIAYGSGNNKHWEKIGDTQFDFSDLKDLAFKSNISLVKGDGANVLRVWDSTTNTGAKPIAQSSNVKLKTNSSHTTDEVLGEATPLVASDSEVTITGTVTDGALGVGTTFKSSTSSVIWEKKGGTGADKNDPNHGYKDALGTNASFTTTVATTNKYLKATASNMDIDSDGNEVYVLSGIGTNSADSFYNKADPMKAKLATASVYGTNGSEDVCSVSNISTKYLTLTSVPVVTDAGTADTWAFNYNSGTSTLEIGHMDGNSFAVGSGNGTGMQLAALGSTVATGDVQDSSSGAGTSVVTGMTISPVVAAKKASTATTVATGALLHDSSDETEHSTYVSATGSEVVYDLDTNTANAVVGLGTQNHSSALTGVSVIDPTVVLSLENSNATGRASVATAIAANNISTTINSQDKVSAIISLADATADSQTVTVDTLDVVDVVTEIGSGTAAGQAITVENDDFVDVITGLGDMQADRQSISIDSTISNRTAKVALYEDLDVSVS